MSPECCESASDSSAALRPFRLLGAHCRRSDKVFAISSWFSSSATRMETLGQEKHLNLVRARSSDVRMIVNSFSVAHADRLVVLGFGGSSTSLDHRQ